MEKRDDSKNEGEKRTARIAIVLPYFGELPNYFPLWLKSASYNLELDFLIFSDADYSGYVIPENVHITNMTFENIQERVAKIIQYTFVLDRPYKLCDYKPLYGLIFKDEVKEYEFWGHCDSDIIWGRLSKFVTADVLDNYDRIYTRGHLCIYRNKNNINRAALQKCDTSCISSKDVYTHRYSAHFDEGELINQLMTQNGVRTYDRTDCADISFQRKQFICMRKDHEAEMVYAFLFDKGRLIGYTEGKAGGEHSEYAYAHLQKRNMTMEFTEDTPDRFWIVPDEFLAGGGNKGK